MVYVVGGRLCSRAYNRHVATAARAHPAFAYCLDLPLHVLRGGVSSIDSMHHFTVCLSFSTSPPLPFVGNNFMRNECIKPRCPFRNGKSEKSKIEVTSNRGLNDTLPGCISDHSFWCHDFLQGKFVENSFTTVVTMDSAWPVAMFVQVVHKHCCDVHHLCRQL